MKIAVAGDSAGSHLAGLLGSYLKTLPGIEVADLNSTENDRGEYYANIAERVARAILAGEFERGIPCCGTDVGVAVSANKVPGILAAQTHDMFSAVCAAKSNAAHIITIGARVTGLELAKSIVDAISELDAKYRRPNGDRTSF